MQERGKIFFWAVFAFVMLILGWRILAAQLIGLAQAVLPLILLGLVYYLFFVKPKYVEKEKRPFGRVPKGQTNVSLEKSSEAKNAIAASLPDMKQAGSQPASVPTSNSEFVILVSKVADLEARCAKVWDQGQQHRRNYRALRRQSRPTKNSVHSESLL